MMIVADIHEGLLDAMQKAGVAYLTQRQFALADAENVREFHAHTTDVLNCVWCNGVEAHEETCVNPSVHLVEETINGAIARLKEDRMEDIQQVPETILRIEEFTGRRPPGGESWESQDGFAIVTTRQTVHLGIGNYQSCCESWGYFLTEDDTDKFLGAVLTGITVTDTNRASAELNTKHGIPVYEGDTMFVDIETDRGVLQFVAYNAHNGYYGHTATVRSTQLDHEVTL